MNGFVKCWMVVITAATLMGTRDGNATAVEPLTSASAAEIARSTVRVRIPPVGARQRYRGYLAQAGFPNPDQLGKTKVVIACELKVFQGCGTFNRGLTALCLWRA